MELVTEDLDGRALAAALVANHQALVEAEGRELVLAAAWADLHPAEAVEPRPVLPGMERARRYGGDGTPEAGEFAAAELAVLTGRSLAAAATLVADALDIRHRLPGLWAALEAGSVRAWQARHVARRTRATGLTLAQARAVDAGVTPYVSSLSWGRFLDLLEARIVTAVPARTEERRRAAELDRFVVTGQSTEHGLKTLIAKATAGEIIYLVAMVDRIAQILLLDGDTSPAGVRRSKALGLLAHPTRVLNLLEQHTVIEEHPDPRPRMVEPGAAPAEPVTEPTVVPPHRCADPRPPATLYVHVSRESLDTGHGVARMEDVGPITLGQASEFLRHSHVTIRPVLDLDHHQPVDGYEVPDRLRELLHLRAPASAFPFSPATSRRMDADHTVPYADTGPLRTAPPQTRLGNLGKLTRTEHRIKTHAPGWRHRQPQPGVHTWRTPHGYTFTVDHTGTHRTPPSDSPHERAFARLLAVGN